MNGKFKTMFTVLMFLSLASLVSAGWHNYWSDDFIGYAADTDYWEAYTLYENCTPYLTTAAATDYAVVNESSSDCHFEMGRAGYYGELGIVRVNASYMVNDTDNANITTLQSNLQSNRGVALDVVTADNVLSVRNGSSYVELCGIDKGVWIACSLVADYVTNTWNITCDNTTDTFSHTDLRFRYNYSIGNWGLHTDSGDDTQMPSVNVDNLDWDYLLSESEETSSSSSSSSSVSSSSSSSAESSSSSSSSVNSISTSSSSSSSSSLESSSLESSSVQSSSSSSSSSSSLATNPSSSSIVSSSSSSSSSSSVESSSSVSSSEESSSSSSSAESSSSSSSSSAESSSSSLVSSQQSSSSSKVSSSVSSSSSSTIPARGVCDSVIDNWDVAPLVITVAIFAGLLVILLVMIGGQQLNMELIPSIVLGVGLAAVSIIFISMILLELYSANCV